MTSRSHEAQEYHKLYRTKLWQQLRQVQLAAQPLCHMCEECDVVTAANTVDHIEPHRGDVALFYDPANLASLCASCHSRHKQRIEHGRQVIRYGADGYPV